MLTHVRSLTCATGSVGDAYKSVRRYYANSISDQEKQGAINLFLGKFESQFELMAQPGGASEREDVWELEKDWVRDLSHLGSFHSSFWLGFSTYFRSNLAQRHCNRMDRLQKSLCRL